jgi:methylamine dehydrogenase accessory protein MauD
MTTILAFAVAALWIVVMVLAGVIWVMLRQIGVLYERVAPVGALMDSAGPEVGEPAPVFRLPSLTGGEIAIGGATGRATLLFFLSPTCPVCKKLLPILANIRLAEKSWLDVALASDGDQQKQRAFIAQAGLADFPYALSTDLGMSFRVQKLPFAVLIDAQGVIRGKGLVNSREQLESLFTAHEAGVASIQALHARAAAE